MLTSCPTLCSYKGPNRFTFSCLTWKSVFSIIIYTSQGWWGKIGNQNTSPPIIFSYLFLNIKSWWFLSASVWSPNPINIRIFFPHLQNLIDCTWIISLTTPLLTLLEHLLQIKHNHVINYPKDCFASFERKLTSILPKEQALKKLQLFKVFSTVYCH